MKEAGGKFIIAVNNYHDSQYGEPDYPNSWFVSGRKYALGHHIDKIKKFNSFNDAEKYIKSRKPAYTKNRSFVILYLTGKWWKKDSQLNHFISLETSTPEEADISIIDEEINKVAIGIKMYEKLFANLSSRAVKSREEYLDNISELNNELLFLGQLRIKVGGKVEQSFST